MTRMRFIDLAKEPNLVDGVEYFAAGLVVKCHMQCGMPNQSGKDYEVEYIDPFGRYRCEWRASDEVEISPISHADNSHLKACYQAANNQ